MLFEKALIINLAREPGRYQKTLQRLDSAGVRVPIERIEAFDWREITPEWLQARGVRIHPDAYSPRIGRSFSRGEIGCALSHHLSWQRILEGPYERVLVLEDDATFAADFVARCRKLEEEIAEHGLSWEILYLGRIPRRPEHEKPVSPSLAVPLYSSGLFGLVITKEAARKLLEGGPLQNLVGADEYVPWRLGDGHEKFAAMFEGMEKIPSLGVRGESLPIHVDPESGWYSQTRYSDPFMEVEAGRWRAFAIAACSEEDDDLRRLMASAAGFGVPMEPVIATGSKAQDPVSLAGEIRATLERNGIAEDTPVLLVMDPSCVLNSGEIEISKAYESSFPSLVWCAAAKCDRAVPEFSWQSCRAVIGQKKALMALLNGDPSAIASLKLDTEQRHFLIYDGILPERFEVTPERIGTCDGGLPPALVFPSNETPRAFDLVSSQIGCNRYRSRSPLLAPLPSGAPTVLMAVTFLNQRVNADGALSSIAQLSYPSERIDLRIFCPDGRLNPEVTEWLDRKAGTFRSCVLSKEILTREELRRCLAHEASRAGCDYLFWLEDDCVITCPTALEDLIKLGRSIVAPLLRERDAPPKGNFKLAEVTRGAAERSNIAPNILARSDPRTYQVARVWGAVLMSRGAVEQLLIAPEHLSCADETIYSELRRGGFHICLDNQKDYGFLLPGKATTPVDKLFQKILLINLARDTERLAVSMEGLKTVGVSVPIERVEAVDGHSIDHEWLSSRGCAVFRDYAQPLIRCSLTKGEAGRSLSHLECWRRIVEGPEERVLILEDDILLSPRFLPSCEVLENELSTLPFEWDLLYLGRSARFGEKEMRISHNLVRPLHSWGAYGMIVSKQGARKLLAAGLDRNLIPSDEFAAVMCGVGFSELCGPFRGHERLCALALCAGREIIAIRPETKLFSRTSFAGSLTNSKQGREQFLAVSAGSETDDAMQRLRASAEALGLPFRQLVSSCPVGAPDFGKAIVAELRSAPIGEQTPVMLVLDRQACINLSDVDAAEAYRKFAPRVVWCGRDRAGSAFSMESCRALIGTRDSVIALLTAGESDKPAMEEDTAGEMFSIHGSGHEIHLDRFRVENRYPLLILPALEGAFDFDETLNASRGNRFLTRYSMLRELNRDETRPSVLVAITILEETVDPELALEGVASQSYPPELMSLLIFCPISTQAARVKEWISRAGNYRSIRLVEEPLDRGQARSAMLGEAIESGSDRLFFLESYCVLTRRSCLEELISMERSIVGPALPVLGHMPAGNYWTGMDRTGREKRGSSANALAFRTSKCTWQVPCLWGAYLADRRIFEAMRTASQAGASDDEICRSLREDGFFLYVDNHFEYGYIAPTPLALSEIESRRSAFRRGELERSEGGPFVEALAEQLAKLIPSDSLVINVRCGIGRYCRYLAQRGFDCLGVDSFEGSEPPELFEKILRWDPCTPFAETPPRGHVVTHFVRDFVSEREQHRFLSNLVDACEGLLVMAWDEMGPVDRSVPPDLLSILHELGMACDFEESRKLATALGKNLESVRNVAVLHKRVDVAQVVVGSDSPARWELESGELSGRAGRHRGIPRPAIVRRLLKDLTITIPVRIDSAQRLRNLRAILSYIERWLDTNIIICEESAAPAIHRLLRHLDFDYQYMHLPAQDALMRRTKMLNMLARRSFTPFIMNHDVDVLLRPEQYVEALEMLRSGEFEMVYPYSGRFIDLNPRTISDFMETLTLHGVDLSCGRVVHPQSVGGVVAWRTSSFFRGGGENENFLAWGLEDLERFKRYGQLGFRIGRAGGDIFHLTHPRTPNSRMLSVASELNEEEFARVGAMSPEELKAYIETWSWRGRIEKSV